eukprot:7376041-Prymnesium_polylepis.1
MLLWKTAIDLLTSTVLTSINIALLVMPQTSILERGAIICNNGLLAGLVGFSLLASPGWCRSRVSTNSRRAQHVHIAQAASPLKSGWPRLAAGFAPWPST